MENVTPRQLIGRLQNLLKGRKHNSETPLQAYIDYTKAEREELELLLRIPQDPIKGEDHKEEISQDSIKSEDHTVGDKISDMA